MGERVGVAVTLSPASQATPQSIIAAVEPRLRYAARPAIVVIIDTLRESQSRIPLTPARNAAGKVLKNEVRQIVGRVWAKQNERARL
jgi:acyl-CoA synthetase (AMP-forming)/AMP-acid ligase II